VLPSERRDVFEQLVGNIAALLAQISRSPAEIDRIPVNDGTDDQVEARGMESLAVAGSISDFAALMEEDSAFELVGRCCQTDPGLSPPGASRPKRTSV